MCEDTAYSTGEERGGGVMLHRGLHVYINANHVRGVARVGRQKQNTKLKKVQDPTHSAALTETSIKHEKFHACAHQHAGRDDPDHDLEE